MVLGRKVIWTRGSHELTETENTGLGGRIFRRDARLSGEMRREGEGQGRGGGGGGEAWGRERTGALARLMQRPLLSSMRRPRALPAKPPTRAPLGSLGFRHTRPSS